jgi:hypothetical protein
VAVKNSWMKKLSWHPQGVYVILILYENNRTEN